MWRVRNSPIRVDRADIVRIYVAPYPEGPGGPRFGRSTAEGAQPLSLIEGYIPSPLPARKWQGFSCNSGGNLVIELRDGRDITYGPCHRPASIDSLWAHMWDVYTDGRCRPMCGPGGTYVPLRWRWFEDDVPRDVRPGRGVR